MPIRKKPGNLSYEPRKFKNIILGNKKYSTNYNDVEFLKPKELTTSKQKKKKKRN